MDSRGLVEQIKELNLWPADEHLQAEIVQLQQRLPDARALSRELLQKNVLTPYQANQILNGKGRNLVAGPYRIDGRLGEGATARIFSAHHSLIDRKVALKIIRPERIIANPVAVERFLREAHAAASLSHPNVVRAYDVDRVGDVFYYAMELLDGLDLDKLVQKEGKLEVQRIADYIVQAAKGLQHIHENNMVHRDIKPSNLMVTVQSAPGVSDTWGLIKILDLGLARLDEDPSAPDQKTALTKIGTVMGTPDYMAPEQALHSRNADIRSDIYSLGCTFYYALAGRPPFPGGDAIEKMLKHQLEEPAPIESLRQDVPEAMREVLRKMMAKKPAERYQTPQELVDALGPLVQRSLPKAVPVAAAASTVSENIHNHPQSMEAESMVQDNVDGMEEFAFDDGTKPIFSPNLGRVASQQSEWGLWIVLALVCTGAIIALVIAVMVVSR